MTRTSLALSLLAVLLVLAAAPAQKQYKPKIAAASEDGRRQMAGFQIDKSFEAKLFAAEPMLANPVCLWVDAKGRVFIGETFRQEQGGVPDNRSFSFWRNDDLSITAPVRPDGKISVPLAGDVLVGDKTPEEVSAEITEKIGKIICRI